MSLVRSRFIILLAVFFSALLLTALAEEVPSSSARPEALMSQETLEVWFPIMAEADCTLIKRNEETILIDCGTQEDYPAVRAMLHKAGVRKLNHVIITHPHHDHIGSLKAMMRGGRVQKLYMFHDCKENEAASITWKQAAAYGVPVRLLRSGATLDIADVHFDTYKLNKPRASLNDRSGVLKLTWGERTMLIMADITPYGMGYMVRQRSSEWLKSEVLRVPHHGQKEIPEQLAAAIDPDIIVITAKPNGRPGKLQARVMRGKLYYTYKRMLKLTADESGWHARWQ